MSKLSPQALQLVKDVVSLPTAPFREELVQEFIWFFAQERGIPALADRFGNIILEYRPTHAAADVALPRVAFTAHLDHPGFEVLSFNAATKVGEAESRGGIHAAYFPGAELTFYTTGKDKYVGAKATSPLVAQGTEPGDFMRFTFEAKGDIPPGSIGWFDVAFVTLEGDRFNSKSCDDLAQAGLLLALHDELRQRQLACRVYTIFTRAEEVGFVGAHGALETELLPPPDVPLMVLECSRALPNVADIGAGPVVRVGDRGALYDADMDTWMSQTARKLEADSKRNHPPGSPELFKFQRALMSGGACEAALLACKRPLVGAMALPLGNYHNVGSTRAECEYISVSDMGNELELMLALAQTPFFPRMQGDFLSRVGTTYSRLKSRLSGNKFASVKQGEVTW